MKLSDLSIRRPVLASMVSLALVLFGAIGYTRLAVREFPDVDPPIVSVSTELPGANPQVVESAVTDILEEELSTVEGLRTLTSSSAEGFSNITLEFNLERRRRGGRPGRARQGGPRPRPAARGRARAGGGQAGGRRAAVLLAGALGRELRPAAALRHRRSPGEEPPADPARRRAGPHLRRAPLLHAGLALGRRALGPRAHRAGRAAGDPHAATSRCRPAASSPTGASSPSARWASSRRRSEFAELVVSSDGGVLVKLKDLGRVELGAEDERSALRFKGTSAVAIGVVRQSKANIIQVADAIRHELPRIQESLPPGVKLNIAFDESIFVSRSIREARGDADHRRGAGGDHHLHLPPEPAGDDHPRPRDPDVDRRDLRDHVLPRLLDQQLHPAGADAGDRHRGGRRDHRAGERLPASGGAGRESRGGGHQRHPRDRLRRHRHHHLAGGGVHAAGLPQGLDRTAVQRVRHRGGGLGGDLGLRGPDAHARCSAPRSCACRQRHGVLYRALESGFNALASGYGRTLRAALRYRWGGGRRGRAAHRWARRWCSASLKREFVPPEDKGWFFSIIIAPEGSSLAYTDGYQRQAEAVLDKTKDVESYFSVVNIGDGVSRGMIFTNLVDFDQRTRSIQDIIGEVQARLLRAFPGVFAFANNPPAFGFGSPVQFVIQNPDFDLLVKGNDTLLARARQVKGLINVDSDLRVNKPRADGQLRPRPGRGPGRARGRRGHHAPGAARRQPHQHLHPEQQAVRRHRAARSTGARHAERHDRASTSGAAAASWSSSRRWPA